MSDKWSEQDERTLRRLYPYANNRELGAMLGRTVESLRQKAKQLGLKKSTKRRLPSGLVAGNPEPTAHGYRTVTAVPGATITRHTLL